MRRWIAAPLLFAAAVGLLLPEAPRAAAQPKDAPSAETFRTADGMELHGLFHATSKDPSKAPVVVFLYPPGPDRDMTKGDWAGLAQKLNTEGYHVFQFDWRGHGKSTKITNKEAFYKNSYLNSRGNDFNAFIKTKPGAGSFSVKDLGPNGAKFMPAYLNDLAAVRYYLDTKNDNKELNSSSIYIVGAGDAAALGMAWLAAEWNRPAVYPNVNALGMGVPGYEFVPQALLGGVVGEAGADFGGAVWLSATRPTSFRERAMQHWIAPPNKPTNQAYAPKMRENNPMLFAFAEKDTAGEKQAKWFFNEMLAAEPKKGSMLDPVAQTKLFVVKGGESLQGVKLLGQNTTLKTEDNIVFYFQFLQKERQKLPSKARKYENPYFIDVRYFGLGITP
jgi:pimeloyl-ACP methyl ester carboxylesterase